MCLRIFVSEGTCHQCGEAGHKASGCWQKEKQQQPQQQDHREGQDKGKGAGKGKIKGKHKSKNAAEKCYMCGRLRHRAKECRSQKG